MKDFLKAVVYGGAFAVLFIPLYVSDSMFFPFITGKNFAFRIIVEIIFASWAVLALLDTRYRPRLSWIMVSAIALLGIMFVADYFGVHPMKSFWSNYERMDGYMTLLHFFMYFTVLGSVFSNKEIDFLGFRTTTWRIFAIVAMVAAVIASFLAFRELTGQVVSAKGWRLNATLGNAAYMAIYMLFNSFIALWLMIHTKSRVWQGILAALAALFAFLLIQTATRGTIVGLGGGFVIGALYIAIFSTEYPKMRKIAFGAVMVVVLAVAALYTNKESDFVQDNPILRRTASIGLSELDLRMTIWEMALEGVEERPLLGWGQGNFNYIFNEKYRPELYSAELWYDRAHNVFLDWLVAGGILGLVAYLGLFAAMLWYIAVRPLLTGRSSFTVAERGVLLGITAGYFAHNLVVFDNIVSFIFFAILLAIVHSRESEPIPFFERIKVDENIVSHVVAPTVLVITGVIIYLVNVPGMQAAGDIIDAISAKSAEEQMAQFREAYSRDSFADQEITEQLTQRTLGIINNQNMPMEMKNQFAQFAEQELLRLAKEKPNDARIHNFIASFYRSIGQFDKAAEQGAIARSLSPNKPAMAIEQAITEYARQDYEAMNQFFREAYELEPSNVDAQVFLAAGLMFTEDEVDVDAIVSESNWPIFAMNDFALQSADANEHYDILVRIMETRIDRKPDNAQYYASLAFIHYRAGEIEAAKEILDRAGNQVPSFKPKASCYLENIEAGKAPDEGC